MDEIQDFALRIQTLNNRNVLEWSYFALILTRFINFISECCKISKRKIGSIRFATIVRGLVIANISKTTKNEYSL